MVNKGERGEKKGGKVFPLLFRFRNLNLASVLQTLPMVNVFEGVNQQGSVDYYIESYSRGKTFLYFHVRKSVNGFRIGLQHSLTREKREREIHR